MMYRLGISSFLALALLMFVSACSVEPEKMQEQIESLLIEDPNLFELEEGTEDGAGPRLCADTAEIVEAKGSGTEWLRMEMPPDAPSGAGGGEVGPFQYILSQIQAIVEEGTQQVFTEITGDQTYKTIVNSIMALAIIAVMVGIIGGVVPISPQPLFFLVLKIVLVYALVSEWDFFNENIRNFFEGIVDGMISEISGMMSSTPVNEQIEMFTPADETITKFFSLEFVTLVLASLTAGWTGAFYAIAMIVTVVAYVIAILRASYIFLTALIVRALLYALAPIFLLMIMFQQTRSLFDNWLIQLTSFSLQPILLFAFLGFFYEMLEGFMGQLVLTGGEGKLCYMIYPLSQGTDMKLFWWSFSEDGGISRITGTSPQNPIDFLVLASMMIISYMMILMGTWAVDAAQHISSGIKTAAGITAQGWADIRGRIGAPTSNPVDPRGYKEASDYYGGAGPVPTIKRNNKGLKG